MCRFKKRSTLQTERSPMTGDSTTDEHWRRRWGRQAREPFPWGPPILCEDYRRGLQSVSPRAPPERGPRGVSPPPRDDAAAGGPRRLSFLFWTRATRWMGFPLRRWVERMIGADSGSGEAHRGRVRDAPAELRPQKAPRRCNGVVPRTPVTHRPCNGNLTARLAGRGRASHAV